VVEWRFELLSLVFTIAQLMVMLLYSILLLVIRLLMILAWKPWLACLLTAAGSFVLSAVQDMESPDHK
jgi:hypothetical protein